MRQSLYQKYRPASFGDLVGQPQVTTVLEKAVEKKEPEHAYLFTGPRGIGKTSAARIFAKKLDCQPIDTFEIDAASYTGVENIRELNASVHTQPVESPYKTYILDEVHMLSKAAFNAFLKTLEEPPGYIIFILVTTESEKVPDTIVSRCVPLPFRQPPLLLLQKQAIAIAEKEGRTLPEQSAALIALMADRSFRDMVTIVQKVLFVAEDKEVSHEMVEEVLGAPKHEMVHTYVQALATGKVQEGIAVVSKAAEANIDMLLFARLCLRKVRALLLVSNKVAGVLDDFTHEEQAVINDLAQQGGITCATLRGLLEASLEIPRASVKTLPLELLLVNQCVPVENVGKKG